MDAVDASSILINCQSRWVRSFIMKASLLLLLLLTRLRKFSIFCVGLRNDWLVKSTLKTWKAGAKFSIWPNTIGPPPPTTKWKKEKIQDSSFSALIQIISFLFRFFCLNLIFAVPIPDQHIMFSRRKKNIFLRFITGHFILRKFTRKKSSLCLMTTWTSWVKK